MYPKSTECVYQTVIKYTGAGVQGVFNGLVHKMYNQKSNENGVIHFEDENGGACLRECV